MFIENANSRDDDFFKYVNGWISHQKHSVTMLNETSVSIFFVNKERLHCSLTSQSERPFETLLLLAKVENNEALSNKEHSKELSTGVFRIKHQVSLLN